MKTPKEFGEFLALRLESDGAGAFDSIEIAKTHLTPMPDGWVRVLVPMHELNPYGERFDQLTVREVAAPLSVCTVRVRTKKNGQVSMSQDAVTLILVSREANAGWPLRCEAGCAPSETQSLPNGRSKES
jgi:hypothetical protein